MKMKADDLQADEAIEAIPELAIRRGSRQVFALHAGVSGDHYPIHIDTDFIQKVGVDDVFTHGMPVMAWLGRALTNFVPRSTLRSWGLRSASIIEVSAEIHCCGTATEPLEQDGEQRLRLGIVAADRARDIKLKR